MAEWQYRIHRIPLLHDAELDNQIETILEEYGTKGWELVQVFQRHTVPEDPFCRLIFKSEKTLD
jgi:hypothetical protein